MFIFFPEIINV